MLVIGAASKCTYQFRWRSQFFYFLPFLLLSTCLGVDHYLMVSCILDMSSRVSLVLHVADRRLNWTAKAAVKQLRSLQETLNLKVKQSTTITVQRINTFYCLDNCSNHGTCEPLSKQCICDTLWIENPFRARFGEKAPNCGKVS